MFECVCVCARVRVCVCQKERERKTYRIIVGASAILGLAAFGAVEEIDADIGGGMSGPVISITTRRPGTLTTPFTTTLRSRMPEERKAWSLSKNGYRNKDNLLH